jgi:hypothetical protein
LTKHSHQPEEEVVIEVEEVEGEIECLVKPDPILPLLLYKPITSLILKLKQNRNQTKGESVREANYWS